jgi:hypothetical protein
MFRRQLRAGPRTRRLSLDLRRDEQHADVGGHTDFIAACSEVCVKDSLAIDRVSVIILPTACAGESSPLAKSPG